MGKIMLDLWNKIKTWALGIVSVIGAILAALFWYEKTKNADLKAKDDNIETKSKVAQINQQIDDLEKETKDKENEPQTKESLLDFVNNVNKPK